MDLDSEEEIVMRWYQDGAVDALEEDVQDPKCHPVAVIPTGGGKTFVICEFVNRVLTRNPYGKVLVLSHVKKILSQDYNALDKYFGGFGIGMYSASFKSREVKQITVAGIQSVHRKAALFKDYDIIIIDECHLVTIRETGMYRKFLSQIKANYVGLTATHFRLGHGYIHRGEGALFNKISYDLSSPENYARLVSEGFLCRLVSKGTLMRMDTTKTKIRAGDFAVNALSDQFDREAITKEAVKEIVQFGENYRKWLTFAIDIPHAEHITQEFKNLGVSAVCVHSKMSGDFDDALDAFEAGKYRVGVSVDMLTTGVDIPAIDLIALLRPTKSPVIHVQTIGRGGRPYTCDEYTKDHTLVLDFAGNTARLGPIDNVQIKVKGDKIGPGEPIMKECPSCQGLWHPTVKVCDYCGHVFQFKQKLQTSAGHEDITTPTTPTTAEWHDVHNISYSVHNKAGKPPILKVTYKIGENVLSQRIIHEWICYDYEEGFARRKARHWVRYRMPNGSMLPLDTAELHAQSSHLKKPWRILVNLNDKFPQIKDAKF